MVTRRVFLAGAVAVGALFGSRHHHRPPVPPPPVDTSVYADAYSNTY